MEDTRVRGIAVHPMPEEISGPFDQYALLVREDGEMRMIHTEGVAYRVDAEKPWRWNDYSDTCPTFTPAELMEAALQAPTVDLADWVRTFGARLESNFYQIVRWNGEAE